MSQSGEQPAISIIIPCKGHGASLTDCLASLQRQTFAGPFEIIVVDSASDPAVRGAAERFDKVRVLSSDGNLIAGLARNLGVSQTRSDHLAFIDADCVAEPGWLAAAMSALDEGVMLVGGAVLDALPNHPIAVADNLLQFVDFSASRPDEPATYFPACNMAVRRRTFNQVGGFVDTKMTGGEDTLLCEAIKQAHPDGLAFRRVMAVRHLGRTTVGAMCSHHRRFGYGRGLFGLHLKAHHQRLCARRVMIPLTVVKRCAYIFKRLWRWRRYDVLRAALLFPLILVGLLAWSIGFRRGCVEALKQETP